MVSLVKVANNIFKLTLTNMNTAAALDVESVTIQVRPPSSDVPYSAVACLRDEGSTSNCSDPSTTPTATGAVPGVPTKFLVNQVIGTGTSITRELYIDSNYINPSTLQAEVSEVYFNGTKELYMVTAQ